MLATNQCQNSDSVLQMWIVISHRKGSPRYKVLVILSMLSTCFSWSWYQDWTWPPCTDCRAGRATSALAWIWSKSVWQSDANMPTCSSLTSSCPPWRACLGRSGWSCKWGQEDREAACQWHPGSTHCPWICPGGGHWGQSRTCRVPAITRLDLSVRFVCCGVIWREEGHHITELGLSTQYRHTLLWDMVIISHLTHWKSQKNNHWQGHYESELLVKFDFYILMVGTLSPVVYIILFMSGKFHTRETSCLSLSSTTAEISWGELRHSLIISVSARKINMDNIWLSLVTLGTHLTCDLNLQHNKQGRLLTS